VTRSGRPRGRWRQDAGALTLTYVIVLPCVLLFIMVMVQASFWFLARDAALAAARQGADAARAYGAAATAGPAAAMAFARQAGDGYLLDPQVISRGSTAATISITVRGHVPSFVPGVVVRISETVQAPVERFHS
jgi:Flp pilus assembly protein TadG